MNAKSQKPKIRNLIIFCTVALLIGWIGVLVDRALPEQEGEESLGMAIWLIFPLITVIILRSFMGDGWKDAGLLPKLKSNGFWYAIALLIYPLVTGLSLLLGYGLGWMDFSSFEIKPYFNIFLSLLLVNIIKNIFEESVWRGYLTVKLLQFKLSDLQLYLIIGLVWGLWHAPYYLVFLPEESMMAVLPVERISFMVLAVINMIIWTWCSRNYTGLPFPSGQ